MAQDGIVLTEAQLQVLEKRKATGEAHGEIETHHPGYLGSQDTYYVGYFKGVGKVYSQVYIDTYTRVADAKLYEDKTALTAADILNDLVVPWYEEQGIPILRILTDRGTEYKGKIENHAYELFLSISGIEHTTTKAYSPQTNGICERFNKTMKQEFLKLLCAGKYTTRLMSCKEILIFGFIITIMKDLILASFVMVKRPSRLLRIVKNLPLS